MHADATLTTIDRNHRVTMTLAFGPADDRCHQIQWHQSRRVKHKQRRTNHRAKPAPTTDNRSERTGMTERRSNFSPITYAVTGPPPMNYDFKTRVIGGSRSPLCSPPFFAFSFSDCSVCGSDVCECVRHFCDRLLNILDKTSKSARALLNVLSP